ncbi:MAG: flagellar basal body rod protein FlgC [Chlamydiales bacterium]|jgi:flagellar basal-body rod protein FlgC|nr:flagellar basal body rod protein FlgC [Chlamydiales bacterium]NCF71634.1 flagellar basal body rod protein FlgC [Chlamydiales bacterium]
MTPFHGLFRSARISGSALKANRNWMNVISNNLANENTLSVGKKDKEGNFVPYSRQVPVFQKILSENLRSNKVNNDVKNGVKVSEIFEAKGEVKKIYDPSHPAARRPGTKDAGYVYYPDINLAKEMADMKVAAASYEANVLAMSTSNKLLKLALNIGRRV